MRRGIRQAAKDGFTNVAVVRALDGPALEQLPFAAADDRTLKRCRAHEDWCRMGAAAFDRLAAESLAMAPASSRPAGTRTSGPARNRSPCHGWPASARPSERRAWTLLPRTC